MTLVGGHPFLTRLALHQVTVGRMDVNTLFTEVAEESGPFGDHLREQTRRLAEYPELKQALIAIWRRHIYEENNTFYRLKQAGLIKRVGRQVVPHNKLYDRYFARYFNL